MVGAVCSDEFHVECLAERDTSISGEMARRFRSSRVEVEYMVHRPTGAVPFRQEEGYPLWKVGFALTSPTWSVLLSETFHCLVKWQDGRGGLE